MSGAQDEYAWRLGLYIVSKEQYIFYRRS